MKEKELNAESIFVTEKTDNKILKEVINSSKIPGNYIEVKLSSVGKLSTPSILHVRNYTFEEALELSDMNSQNEKEIIINVLNQLIFEDFDAGLLHEQEAIEILLQIFATWWGTRLEGFKYYVNEDLSKDLIDKPENISIAEIPIKNIKTIELKKEVMEPISITAPNGKSIKCILPRMQTSLIAKKFVDKKYVMEENRFSELKNAMSSNKPFDSEEYQEYLDYLKERGKDYLRVYQAQLLHSVDGVEIEDLSEAIDLLSEIDLTLWKEYNNIVEKYFDFGVSPTVKFDCTINHKPITRRFQFRLLDFLPTVESKDNSGYSFSFG